MDEPHKAAPAALGWNVIEYAPPGSVTITAAQRDDIRRQLAYVAERNARAVQRDDALAALDHARAELVALRAAVDRVLAEAAKSAVLKSPFFDALEHLRAVRAADAAPASPPSIDEQLATAIPAAEALADAQRGLDELKREGKP